MTVINKKSTLLFLATCALATWGLWVTLRPVEIVAVHQRSSGFSDILVTNFPYTDKGKINWWLRNKNMLSREYDTPEEDLNGYYNITFWLFGDGYKEEGKYDRLCFNDMTKKENCIEKNAVLTISNSKNLGTIFTVYEGKYQLKENNEVVKFKNAYEVN